MEKRDFRRIYSNITVDVFYKNRRYEGTAGNLSVNGLYIYTDICPPCESYIEVLLNLGDDVFMLCGKVKTTANTNGSSGGMGVELLNPSKRYSEFVSSLLPETIKLS